MFRHWKKYHAEPRFDPTHPRHSQSVFEFQEAARARLERTNNDENERATAHRPKPAPKPQPSTARDPLSPARPPPLRDTHLIQPVRSQDVPRAPRPDVLPSAAQPPSTQPTSADSAQLPNDDEDPFAHPAVQAKLSHFQKEIATLQENVVELASRLDRTLPDAAAEHEHEAAQDDDVGSDDGGASGPSSKRRKTSTSSSTSPPLSPEDDAALASAAGCLAYLHKPFLSDADVDALSGMLSADPLRARAAVELRRTVRGLLPPGPRWDALTRDELIVLQTRTAKYRRKATHLVRLHLVDILGLRLGELVGASGETKRAALLEDAGLAWTCAEREGERRALEGEAVTRAVSALLYGPRSLSKTTAVERRTAGKSSWAKVWHVESVTPGLVALAVTIVTSCLRGDKQFLIADDPRNANFAVYRRVVERLDPSSSSSSSDGARILEELEKQLIPQPGDVEAAQELARDKAREQEQEKKRARFHEMCGDLPDLEEADAGSIDLDDEESLAREKAREQEEEEEERAGPIRVSGDLPDLEEASAGYVDLDY